MIARFPNPISGDTEEELFLHYKGKVEAIHVATTGITTLRVQAFRPEDALAVNRTLLTLGEELVNRMNERIRNDAVRFAESEVNRSQQRLVDTQIKITEFRNRELMLDPSKSSLIVAELIGRLSAELAVVTAQLREVEAASANSPQILACSAERPRWKVRSRPSAHGFRILLMGSPARSRISSG